MTNDFLLQQLDFLRDQYIRQQKAASGLQTSLKGVTDAHSRVQKALANYRDQNTGADVTNIQTMFANFRLKEDSIDPLLPDLRRELKMLIAIAGALKDAATALRSDPVDVVRLDKAIATLQPAAQQDISILLPELGEELNVAQRTLGDQFGEKLRDALAQMGITIDGRAPKFTVGRFELDANFAKRFVTVRYGNDMVIPRVHITVEATIKAYQSAAKQVTERAQDGKVWIAQFYEAYHSARRKRASEGTRVNIVDCYMELVLLRQGRSFASEPSKRTFTDYTRAQFIYDFYEFTGNQRLAHNGQFVKAHVATKAQVDNPIKSMWIVEGDAPHDGRYIADIEFVKD